MNIKMGKMKKPVKTVKEMTILAGKAMKNGFYLEAIWILSEIMEEKLKKIVSIAEVSSLSSSSNFELYLKKIKLLISGEKHPTLKSHFPIELVSSLRSWKNNRNILMKDMVSTHVSWERKERLAKQGIDFLKELNRVYKHFKLAYYVPPKHGNSLPEVPVSAELVITETFISPIIPDAPASS